MSDAEYGQFTQSRDRLGSYDRKFQDLGFKGVEDLDRFAPVFKADPNQTRAILAALTPAQKDAAQNGGAGGGPMTAEQIKAMVDDGIGTYKREQAGSQHDAAVAKVPEFIKAQLAEILGEDATDELTSYEFNLMATGLMYQMREQALGGKDPAAAAAFMYPKDHPLHGHRLAPFSPENTKGVWDTLKGHLPKRKGGVLAKIGDAANLAPARSTPAGGQGRQSPGEPKGKADWKTTRDREVAAAVKTARG